MKVPTARTTVRGFQTPMTSTDDESDAGLCNKTGTSAIYTITTPSKSSAKKNKKKKTAAVKKQFELNDVVSANCSPSLRPTPSPSISGISMLRNNNLDKINLSPLDPSSRTSTMMTMRRVPSYQGRGFFTPSLGLQSAEMSRANSRDGPPSEGSVMSDTGSTSYEIQLENDFVNDEIAGDIVATCDAAGKEVANRKMCASDFETLRCLGKGAYGTVFLVKQKSTGRLFAQKQFKKASLVVHKKLVEQTKTERQILESVSRHPFVVKLFYAFQDQDKLYLILEYGQGGELFHHLSTERMFSEQVAAFYMAEMILAVTHLHSNMGIVYRDLKPENCLLDSEGHLLLTDFGLSKVSVDEDTCNSMLGTVDYMAPEVIQGKKYGKAVDWWSLGALGVDLMTGAPPFRGGNNAKIQENILKQKLQLPYYLSADAKDLLTRLLRREPKKRLGANMPHDLETIKKHRFFRKIDWKKLEARGVEPPIQPLITDPELAENFSVEFTDLALSPRASFAEAEEYTAAGTGTGMEMGMGIGRSDAMDINGGGSGGRAPVDDPFHGFSFVAPSSLLENERFIALGS